MVRSSPASVTGWTRSSAARDTPLPNHHLPKVPARQPAGGHVMVQRHRRLIHAAKPRGASAHEQLGHFLAENQPCRRCVRDRRGSRPIRVEAASVAPPCSRRAAPCRRPRRRSAGRRDPGSRSCPRDRRASDRATRAAAPPRSGAPVRRRSRLTNRGPTVRRTPRRAILIRRSTSSSVKAMTVACDGGDAGVERARASLPRLEQIPQADREISSRGARRRRACRRSSCCRRR